MLVTTGYHSPKHFPKSPDEYLKKATPPKPMNKAQWKAMIRHLLK